jgi:hypothetical protein
MFEMEDISWVGAAIQQSSDEGAHREKTKCGAKCRWAIMWNHETRAVESDTCNVRAPAPGRADLGRTGGGRWKTEKKDEKKVFLIPYCLKRTPNNMAHGSAASCFFRPCDSPLGPPGHGCRHRQHDHTSEYESRVGSHAAHGRRRGRSPQDTDAQRSFFYWVECRHGTVGGRVEREVDAPGQCSAVAAQGRLSGKSVNVGIDIHTSIVMYRSWLRQSYCHNMLCYDRGMV